MSSPDSAPPWPDLPSDVLMAVASLLPSLADLHCFRAVCRSWGRAAATWPPPPLPYLTFPSKADPLTRCFYSLSDGRIHRVHLPEDARHWRCCGSSHGWLAMAGLDAGLRLFNPLTGARLELPPLTTLPQVLHVVTGPDADTYPGDVYGRPSPDHRDRYTYPWYVVESTEGYPWRCTAEELRDELVQKAVSSPVGTPSDLSDCTVMVLYAEYKVASARPGDAAWTSLGDWHSPWYKDLVCHENRFFLLTWQGSVRVFDVANAGGALRMEELAPRNESFPLDQGGQDYLCVARPSGEVLLVRRHVCRQRCPMRTESLEVWRLDLAGGGRRWVTVGSLGGGGALFLGGGDCSAEERGGRVHDCIYFVADNLELCVHDEESECALEVGRYHMKDGTTEMLVPPGCDEIKQHPVWISPSL